jgi:LysR family glycine cleavage system transcriptional activator
MKSIHRYAALRKTSTRHLHAFEAAYLHGSFAAAALELCVTASAVSHAIQSLERGLGALLFERRKRSIVPTAAGSRLYAVVRRAFSDLDRELSEIVAGADDLHTISVQCAPSFAAIWLMPGLPDFLKANPDIDLRLSAVHEAPDFLHGGLDLAIVYGVPMAGAELIVEPLTQVERYVPMCSPSLLGGQTLPLPTEALEDYLLIHNQQTAVSWRDWATRYVDRPINLERGLRFDRSFMMFNAVADGLGMCLDSTLLAHPHLQRGSLVLPFGDAGIDAPGHHLCMPRDRADQAKIQTFVAWIRSRLPRAVKP